MSNRFKIHARAGHSLVELMTALVASAALLVGLASVVMIGRQIAYAPTASNKRLEASQVVDLMLNDLRFATFIVAHTNRILEFVVADRDGNGSAERIRYEWSGTSGDPLLRTYNGGTATTVLAGVRSLSFTYTTTDATTTLTPTSDSVETLLASNTSVQGSNERTVNLNSLLAQQVNPAAFSSVPSSATSWNATRVEFYGRQSGSETQTLYLQFRSAGDPSTSPTGSVLASANVAESTITSNSGWNSVTLSSAARGLLLSPRSDRRYSIVWAGNDGSNNSCRLTYYDNTPLGVVESDDAGANSDYNTTRQIFYRLYGTYTSPGTARSVVRSCLSYFSVTLQAADASHSKINAGINLVNTPELLSGYWRTDFDSNPTSIDITRDGTSDWAMSSGTFNTNTLAGGIWTASGALESRPLNNFTTVTTAEVRCRNTSVGGNGDVFQINADRQSSLYAPLIVRMQLQSDGTQTLTLYKKTNSSTTVSLFQRTRLSNDFVRYRLTIVPQYDLVNLQINGEDQGTFTYSTFAPPSDDGYATIYTDTSTSEFDYAEVRASE